MKFSHKIFLAIFGTAVFAAVTICLVLNGILSKTRTNDFKDSYIDHMNLMAKTLERIEDSQSQIAFNAAETLKIYDEQGTLKSKNLEALATSLGLNKINIHSQTHLENFPDFDLAKSSVYQSPIIKAANSQVGQYTLVASIDGKRVIEAIIYFDDATKMLREMIQHDVDNLSVELIGPNNESLGRLRKEDFNEALDLPVVLKKSDGAYVEGDTMTVLTSLKGTMNKDYRLVATISTQTLEKELRKVHLTLLIVALSLIVFALWLSQILTKTLLKKIDVIFKTLEKITQTQDYSQRVLVSVKNSKDELDALGKNLNHMLSTLQSHQAQLLETERDRARSQIAAQVAHDIRSPLMSMNMALSQIESSQLEPLAILKSAVARVAGIVQKLSSVSAKPDEESTVEAPKLTLIEPLITSVFNEHSVRRLANQTLLLHGITARPQVWSVVQVNEIQSALSNIINNAFEAGANEVTLSLTLAPKEWTLAVKDNGKGMSSAVLEKIFERSFTFGKKTGSGLGLFQAKAAIEWSGGTLEVQSAEGQGTTFTLRMPREKTPSWAPSVIEVNSDQPIVFVDDDKNVLNAWREKIQSMGLQQASFFASTEELRNSFSLSSWPEQALLVIDQNLNESTKGLEILGELGIGKRAYLCTTDFDDKWIQDQVKKINGHLIPKIWVSQFEIKVRTS
ncbi:ATP-binding protein [Bdellovibrio sp. HCB-110]|uniref:ATP-binding protein n=1 Tax=Bdellovibrio sp. HCB-110 TaxID=3391182 RepID=UPI0039B60E94